MSMSDETVATVFEALLREGVIVRHIEGRMVRVTIGLEEENQGIPGCAQAGDPAALSAG